MSAIKNSGPVILGLVIGLILFPISITGFNLFFFPGDLGDARFNLYILEHGYKFFTGQVDWYWHAPFMYPDINVISYSDNLLGSVPVYSFFRVLGFSTLTSFQLWFIAVFALNYTAFYFFAKWLVKNRYAAVLGAFIFAFSIALQSQMSHAQVFARYFIPLAFWMLLKFSEDFKPKYFFLSIFFLVCELYAAIYLGLMTFLPFAIVTIIILISRRSELKSKLKKLKWWVSILLGLGVNVFLTLKLMIPYLDRSEDIKETPFAEILMTVPTLGAHITRKSGSLLWDGLPSFIDSPIWYDLQLFIGVLGTIAFLLFIALALFKRRLITQYGLWLALTGVLLLFFHIKFHDFSLYSAIHEIPGFESMRSISRIINIELFFFAAGIAFIGKLVFERFEKQKSLIFIVALIALCLDNYVNPENTYRYEKAVAEERVDVLSDKIKSLPPNTVISYEPDTIDYAVFVQLDGMLAAQENNLISVNGYTATSKWQYNPYWINPGEHGRNAWFRDMGADQSQVKVIK